MCMHRRNVLSLTLALSRMRSDNIAIMSRDLLWCDSWLMYHRYTPITLYSTVPLYDIIIIFDMVLRQKRICKREK